MTKILSLIITLIVASPAYAVALRTTAPVKSKIEERAINVVFKQQKTYDCTLDGINTNGGIFGSNAAEVRVTAGDPQSAVELALTPFIVEEPKQGDLYIKVKVEGITYSVRKIECTALEQSI